MWRALANVGYQDTKILKSDRGEAGGRGSGVGQGLCRAELVLVLLFVITVAYSTTTAL